MTLRIPEAMLEQIHARLARAYPDEGCGVLLGRDAGPTRYVASAEAFDNAHEGGREDRYTIAPADVAAAERRARAAALDLVGFFHSHPDHPARPSATDVEHGWPWYSYVIVSVNAGRASETTAWRLAGDGSGFEPEPIEIVTAAMPHSGGVQP